MRLRVCRKQVRYKPLLPDGKAPMLLSRLSQSLASRFLCRYTFHQKIDDIIRRYLYLEKKVGNGWTPVTSWSIDGTGSVSITKTYTGTMGITYRTRVVVTTGVDKIDATSTERTV